MGHPVLRAPLGMLVGALSISLAACAPGVAPVPPVASDSAAPSVAPASTAPASTAPSAGASSAAPASTAPSVAPSAPTPGGGEVGIARGTVYDHETRLAPDDTVVSVKSLDETRPYTGTTRTSAGSYVLNGVPMNTQLEITATREGWTSRTQIGVVRPYDPRIENPNVFNFGGRVTQDDRRGIGFFIAPYPEIAEVTPTDDDRSQPADKLTFKLRMSEALDAENRRRLAAAFTIVPNNEEAITEDEAFPDAVATDPELEGLRLEDPETPEYAFRQNSGFLNGLKVSTFRWDEAGLEATFTLEAPLKTDRDEEAEYAFLLIQRDDDEITDVDGNPLGMNAAGEFGETNRGDILYNAIAEPSVNLTEGFDDAEERWADTHLSFTRFSVVEDKTAPTITEVLARRDYLDDDGDAVDRIEITFSEPMVAYPRITAPGLLSLNNYVLAAAATENALDDLDLEAGSPEDVDADASAANLRDAFEESARVRIDSEEAQSGNFEVGISVRDPKVVEIDLPAGSLPLDADFIKVLAGKDAESGTVGDPAGNPVTEATRQVVGPIF